MIKGKTCQDPKPETIEANPPVLVDPSSLGKKNPLRILHVDNDISFLQVSKKIMEKKNRFEIDYAPSVEEAFRKLKTINYDVVVSDYGMPIRNGLDFLKDLREQKNNIAFILFAGECREEIAVKALSLGADRYLSKRGSPHVVYFELAYAINKIMELKNARNLLDASDLKYRTLVEKSLQGIMIAQATPLRIIFTNASMGKMLGTLPKRSQLLHQYK